MLDQSKVSGDFINEVGGAGKLRAVFLNEKMPAGEMPTKTGEIAKTKSNPNHCKYCMTRNHGTKALRGVDYLGKEGDGVYSLYDGKVTRIWNSVPY